ncbi:MAG: hypothetical protein LBM23_07120 [Propionibacteriaceae bacterium]|jgi:hypothetical protein|nr:hypothetical protein [Propionibacteriaceae bacterium]
MTNADILQAPVTTMTTGPQRSADVPQRAEPGSSPLAAAAAPTHAYSTTAERVAPSQIAGFPSAKPAAATPAAPASVASVPSSNALSVSAGGAALVSNRRDLLGAFWESLFIQHQARRAIIPWYRKTWVWLVAAAGLVVAVQMLAWGGDSTVAADLLGY